MKGIILAGGRATRPYPVTKREGSRSCNIMSDKHGVLILSPFYEPNIGGVETHLKDLTNYLRRVGRYRVYVLTYQPLTTKSKGASFEKDGDVEIRRIPWIGYNLFHKLESYPVLEFLYITPWLFLNTIFFMFKHQCHISIIHAQGFNAAFIGRFISAVFKTKLIVSIHAIYNLKPSSVFAKLIRRILEKANKVLTLSVASKKELVKIGLSPDSIDVYTYWVDQKVFKPLNRLEVKKRVGWDGKFIVLFVGRFIEIKGMNILLEAARNINKEIYFAFIGDGPLSAYIKEASVRFSNVMFIGRVNNHSLPLYYNAADMVCVPSKYEEGFGRVILEALSCGTPVLASNRGGVPEALDERVGICIDPTADNLRHVIKTLYQTSEKLQQMQSQCREYALASFSEKNAELIIRSYHG